jgi:hypothetical protein
MFFFVMFVNVVLCVHALMLGVFDSTIFFSVLVLFYWRKKSETMVHFLKTMAHTNCKKQSWKGLIIRFLIVTCYPCSHPYKWKRTWMRNNAPRWHISSFFFRLYVSILSRTFRCIKSAYRGARPKCGTFFVLKCGNYVAW